MFLCHSDPSEKSDLKNCCLDIFVFLNISFQFRKLGIYVPDAVISCTMTRLVESSW